MPELRIVDDELWQAVKDRQGELAVKYASTIEAVRAAHANRLNRTHRPRSLLSGLLECGSYGGSYALRGQDRYGCSNHVMNGSCGNSRTIRRPVLEERLLAGLKDRLMAPEVAAEAMRAYAEETNRLNRERRSAAASERKELAGIEKTIKEIVTIIENGGYTRALIDRLCELEARQDELTERLSGATADIPDIHPNVADIYRRKVERLAEALRRPEERDEASAAIRGLIERITLSPGPKRGKIDAVRYGDLGTIIEWTAARDRKRNKAKKNRTETPVSGVSVSVVAGVGFEPTTLQVIRQMPNLWSNPVIRGRLAPTPLRCVCGPDTSASSQSGESALRPSNARAMAAPMRSAAASVSRSPTWAYRSVMLGCLWPSRRETTGSGTPRRTAWLANVCRRSCRRTSSIPASLCWRSLRSADI